MAEFQAWKSVGLAVGQMIRKKGYRSLELFAHEHGIDKSVLGRLVKGERQVRLSTFLKILEGLEISLGELISQPKQVGPKSQVKRIQIRDRTAKLLLGDVDRIEVRKTGRDIKPVVIELSKTGKIQLSRMERLK